MPLDPNRQDLLELVQLLRTLKEAQAELSVKVPPKMFDKLREEIAEAIESDFREPTVTTLD